MMALVRLALRRPYTIAVLSLLILLLGGLSLSHMKVDFFPRINIPAVVVGWNYPGLSAEEMERRVVIISERAYSTTVNGIARVESNCIPGIGLLKVYFHEGADVGTAISQINAVNNTILRILPPGIQPPIMVQYNAATVPIVQINLSSKTLPEEKIFDHALNFVRIKLMTISGMQVPAPFGGKQRQISMDLNPTLMQARGVSAADVVGALQASNLLIPSGTARIGTNEFNILMNSSPPAVDQFNAIPIKVLNGIPITLGDVGKVSDSFAEQSNIVHVDGRRATYLTVLKHGDASSLAVVEATKAVLPEIQAAAPDGLEVKLDFDQSVYVRSAISNVLHEAAMASVLVSLMILLFLGSWRNTVVVISSIPLAMFAGILCLDLTGNTINLMTLGGLALATGILVDDATVAVENIHRNRELGKPLTVAIIDGSYEVALPRTMATLAICIVFLPVSFLFGASKFLFTPLALAVVFSMLASYVLSFALVPMLSRLLLASEQHHHGAPRNLLERLDHGREAFLGGLREFYGRILGVIMRHRIFTLAVFFLVAGASALLVAVVGNDFFPSVDVGILKLHFRGPIGLRIEETEKLVLQVEDEIRKIIPPEELQSINDMVGVPIFYNLAFVGTDNISGMDADILVSLKKPHSRSSAYYADEIRRQVPQRFPGSSLYFQSADIVTQVLNFGLPAPIDVQIQDANFDRAQGYAARVLRALRETPGAVDARVVQVLNYPALRLEVDRLRAARMGITQRDISNSVLTTLSSSGLIAPSYFLAPNGVNYAVNIQAPIDRVKTVDDLLSIPISAPGPLSSSFSPLASPVALLGAPIGRLGNVASLRPEVSFESVSHYSVQRVIDVAANVSGRDLGGVVSDLRKKLSGITAEKDFPKTAKITVRGQIEVMEASFESLGLGLLLAIILVYCLLVILFQSWVDPFIIMMAVPGALMGILWMLLATGTTLNVVSLMGAIMAVGIAVSNSILVVSFANELRAQQAIDVVDAAIEAGKTRLRPVLMTALAMIIGMVPMAMGMGEGGEQNAPLGRAVIGGLIFATITTLFVVPVIYTFLRKKMPILHQLDARFEAEARGETA